MESSKEKKVDRAIQQLMDDNNENNKTRNNSNSSGGESFVAVNADDDEEDRLLLTRLLSQLDAVGDDEKLNQQPESSSLFDAKEEEEEEEVVVSNDAVMVPTAAAGETDLNEGSSSSNCGIVVVDNGEEILRELKEVKRQNFITHCLLSVMIVLTIGWQLSEVSLILKIKDRVTNPFRSLGSLVKGMIPKGPIAPDRNGGGGGGGQNREKQQHPIQAYCPSSLPDLKIPEFPHVELPDFEFTNDEH